MTPRKKNPYRDPNQPSTTSIRMEPIRRSEPPRYIKSTNRYKGPMAQKNLCPPPPQKRLTLLLVIALTTFTFGLLFLTYSGYRLNNVQMILKEIEIKTKDLEQKCDNMKLNMMSSQKKLYSKSFTTKPLSKIIGMTTVAPSKIITTPRTTAVTPRTTAVTPRTTAATQTVAPIESTYIDYLMPHLKNDPNSLRPFLYIQNGRRHVVTVIGMMYIYNYNEDYLFNSLDTLTETLKKGSKNNVVIIVMITETNPSNVRNMSMTLQNRYAIHIASGLLEVLAPSPTFYPNFEEMEPSNSEPRESFNWRLKQNLDALYLMVFAQNKGIYFLLLENKLVIEPDFFSTMKSYAIDMDEVHPEWIFIEYSYIGSVGRLFKCAEIKRLAIYFQLFYKNMTIDWLYDSYIMNKICYTRSKRKNCSVGNINIRPKYKLPVSQHTKDYSSLNTNFKSIKVSNSNVYISLNYNNNDSDKKEPRYSDCIPENN